MGISTILFNGVDPFKQIGSTLSTEGLKWNLVNFNCSRGFIEEDIKKHNFIHEYS